MTRSGLRARQLAPAYSDELRSVFIKRVHQLLALGYARLKTHQYGESQEETITGDLVQAMVVVCDDPASPRWVDRLTAFDDPRVNDGTRKGKQRRRIDIGIESNVSRPRQRFSFEAKRLGERHGISGYLGDEGLGCFLRGGYAREDAEAGMLGYVQSRTPPDWAEKIASAIDENPSRYGACKAGAFTRHTVVRELTFTYRSKHKRPDVGKPIVVFHTLLLMK